jgi:hypothetical protein
VRCVHAPPSTAVIGLGGTVGGVGAAGAVGLVGVVDTPPDPFESFPHATMNNETRSARVVFI